MTARSPHLENGFLRAALAAEEEAEEGPAQLFDVRIALLLMHFVRRARSPATALSFATRTPHRTPPSFFHCSLGRRLGAAGGARALWAQQRGIPEAGLRAGAARLLLEARFACGFGSSEARAGVCSSRQARFCVG